MRTIYWSLFGGLPNFGKLPCYYLVRGRPPRPPIPISKDYIAEAPEG